ncbi:GDSL esterase/lipase At5g45920 isoform X1 [Syzygium oleosum]|uniref:GDSL esterase/lipase At5g45920 isoform X1 n=1 Tax=Syzygium oleosum TaxID=219896 RepID=UPI0024B9CC6F|nr:GDSL esterase/lipase At5g45920 isoform X1 [Syzygium oleosum]XP_056175756.1 GDSL esterase/lipase At5g45920 isoform X1 [Syzygium oleosum]XP_056175757.1 GDSL esterase/lipase At5g45920 isoform X1 [Syzygium oleosum]
MRPKIYIFGDSITEESFGGGGWGALLAHHFSRTADVVLRGYSGYNTRWALKVLDKVFPAAGGSDDAPLAITVFFGANDACLPDRCSAFQHVPLHEYKQNLHSIISTFKLFHAPRLAHVKDHPARGVCRATLLRRGGKKRWPKTQILLISPPPIDEDARLKFPYVDNPMGMPERTNEAAGAYAKACVSVAAECGFPVVDLWTKMQRFPDWGKACLRDGLHLTQTGNRIVFDEVIMKLRDVGLSLESLPVDLPLISDIDPSNPLKSFEN